MLSPFSILFPFLLLSLHVLAAGAPYQTRDQHREAFIKRYALLPEEGPSTHPSNHSFPHRRALIPRRQVKRGVCSLSHSLTSTASSAPVRTQGNDGISTVWVTRTSIALVTRSASASSASNSAKVLVASFKSTSGALPTASASRSGAKAASSASSSARASSSSSASRSASRSFSASSSRSTSKSASSAKAALVSPSVKASSKASSSTTRSASASKPTAKSSSIAVKVSSSIAVKVSSSSVKRSSSASAPTSKTSSTARSSSKSVSTTSSKASVKASSSPPPPTAKISPTSKSTSKSSNTSISKPSTATSKSRLSSSSSPVKPATTIASKSSSSSASVKTSAKASSSSAARTSPKSSSSSSKAASKTASSAASVKTAVSVDKEGDGPYTGDGTWFNTGLGACGKTNVDSDFIVAVSEKLFDTWPGYKGGNPNVNPICGRKISVSFAGNKNITVAVQDRCEGCAKRDLDFTTGAFQALVPKSAGGLDMGRGKIQWRWLD